MVNITNIKHIALILDGNGRWAKKFHRPRTYGHRVGMQNIWPTLLAIKKQNIKHASFYCFSTENWNRPKSEVEFLIKFPLKLFNKNKQNDYIKNNIKVIWMGLRNRVPKETRDAIEEIESKTKDCNGLIFNICLDYGSHEEIESSIRKVFDYYIKNNIDLNKFKIEDLFKNLYSKDSPPIDLLIRTSGEQRLSNFMLLQAAYAELYFTKKHWPEFRESDLKSAIEEYNKRDRRFGEIKNAK
ncbi:polyprenyl diphosphate synthase [Spiroplasma turonicum]|uniref:Isoprenyl transferase n=1 Tax=Spiroplasma turonicum TaxID=216946 RepID=A0A0K1P5F2_9MOLU|nr:polyprenyl diphosphate synthase [Spiroplasma turonicum]AKU79508.1 undecaprenyl pyrophosphate synthase [Spiroplasma turonicum]ALX70531.1 undecaprenyl pyrophosphate synthase [Spiroplasma turonicum]